MLFPGLLSFCTVLNRVGATIIIIIILKNSFLTRIESVVDVNIAFAFLVLANNRYITNEEIALFFVNCVEKSKFHRVPYMEKRSLVSYSKNIKNGKTAKVTKSMYIF